MVLLAIQVEALETEEDIELAKTICALEPEIAAETNVA